MWIIIIIIIIIIINIDINNSNNIYFLLLLLITINEITVETSCYFRAELVSLAAVFCLLTQHSSPTKEEERCVTRQKWLQELAVLYHNCIYLTWAWVTFLLNEIQVRT